MRDEEKTKEQLIKELDRLRQQIAELKALERRDKKKEKILKVSKELFESTFLGLDSAVFILDNKIPPIILNSNPAASKIFGYKREEMLRKRTALLHINKKALLDFSEMLCPTIEKQGYLSAFEFKMKRKNGEIFPTEHSVFPLKDGKGNRIGWVSVVRDITQYKKAQEALSESEGRYRAIFEQAADSIVLIDQETGALTDFNERAYKNLGYTCEEFKKIKIPDFELIESAEEVAQHMKKVIQQGADVFETRHRTKSGQIKNIQVSTRAICIEGKNFIQAIFRDITEHKKIQEALRASQERYQALVDNTVLGITVIDTDYRIMMVNTTFAKLFKKSPKDFVGKYCFKEYEKRQAVCPHCPGRRAMVSKKSEEVETQAVLDDGSRIHVRNRAIPFFGPDRVVKGFIEIVENIDERKKAQQELQDAYQKLKAAQEQLIHSSKMAAMGHLAAGVSHELNQPLTGIKGFTQTALRDLEKKYNIEKDLKRIIKKDLKTILEQAERMDAIIKGIRSFARKSDFVMRKIDINQAIKNSLRLLNQQLILSNIEVRKLLTKDLPSIKGDLNQLQQVFINLITNSRDAIESLKPARKGRLSVKSCLSEDRASIQIIFQDTGCGIPRENLPHIFNPFFTTKSSQGDIGLGLSIAYRIIESHKGRIEVDSAAGKGTTFKITLPIAQEA